MNLNFALVVVVLISLLIEVVSKGVFVLAEAKA